MGTQGNKPRLNRRDHVFGRHLCHFRRKNMQKYSIWLSRCLASGLRLDSSGFPFASKSERPFETGQTAATARIFVGCPSQHLPGIPERPILPNFHKAPATVHHKTIANDLETELEGIETLNWPKPWMSWMICLSVRSENKRSRIPGSKAAELSSQLSPHLRSPRQTSQQPPLKNLK